MFFSCICFNVCFLTQLWNDWRPPSVLHMLQHSLSTQLPEVNQRSVFHNYIYMIGEGWSVIDRDSSPLWALCSCNSSSFCPAAQKSVRRNCVTLRTTVWPLTQTWARGKSDLCCCCFTEQTLQIHCCLAKLIRAVHNKELYGNMDMTSVFLFKMF